MKREDWLWLLLRFAGIYLVVNGLEHLPDLLVAVIQNPGHEDTTRLAPFLRVAVPLAAGLFLLLVRARGDAPIPAEPTASLPSRPGLAREDWLWVGFKLVGLWSLTAAVTQASYYFLGAFPDGQWVPLVGYTAVSLAFSIWLVFGTQLWRWSVGSRAAGG